ncbi:MAG TPA: hypothetical protein PKI62_06145 [bacterium]|nr:hypothetical protein [bacterium]HPR86480.1 hypothetical protein [bacterium]
MDTTATQLGLMMAKNRFYFLETGRGRPLRLISAGALDLDVPFDYQSFMDRQLLSRFSRAISEMIDRFAISATSLSFCLDRRMVQLRRIKVDRDFSDAEVRQQVEWELEQMLVSPRSEYHANFERVRSERDPFEYVIIAVVRKAIVGYLHEIFNATPIKLSQVDVDLLAGIRGLTLLKPQCHGLTALVDQQEDALGITLIKNQNYVAFGELALGPGAPAEENSEEQATRLNDEMLRLMESLGDELLLKSIEEIYLSAALPQAALVALQRLQRAAQIQFLDPLNQIEHSLSLEAEQIVRENARHILPLIGMLQA